MKIRTFTGGLATALVALGLMASSTLAVVTFDPATGTGFVGKGDVQLVYGWNNKQLQDKAASVQFQASSATMQDTAWTCDRDGGPQTQERTNTTTTTTQGLVSKIARERNQITGFILNGYSGTPTVTEAREGPAIASCPTGWTAIDFVAGDPVSLGGSLQVSADGSSWTTIYAF